MNATLTHGTFLRAGVGIIPGTGVGITPGTGNYSRYWGGNHSWYPALRAAEQGLVIWTQIFKVGEPP